MPEITLCGIPGVKLRSMFREQRCQYRYNEIDDASYPITKPNRSRAKQAMEWISQMDKHGTTWVKADAKEIVFVYPSKMPEISPKFASLLGPKGGDSEKHAEARFDSIARDFIRTLKGLSPKDKPDNIQVFSIRKMDKSRSKIVFTRNCTPEGLIHSAEEWQRGCDNVPVFEFFVQTAPFPLQVANIVNNVWKQDGGSAGNVKRMQYYQGVELLLDSIQINATRYYLATLLSHSSGLIKFAGDRQSKSLLNQGNQKEGLGRLLSVIGLLLYKCGYKKEDYMDNTAYLVGQILKISDELHAYYCKIVRKGDIPPQLAGNSVFAIASETPVQALAQLCARMSPYISWAKQYRTKNIQDKDKESWKANWYLNLFEDTADKLRLALTSPIRFDDFGKAQFFIGYLAAFPKKPKAAENEANTPANINTERGDSDGQRD
jgi:hypothetical protein